ncbi:hypothetical protein V6N11_076782 [Hibiscus sabdariffa]|uniref:Uncharacterized protein n=1 Tax=Hibiscus sabdariffa TaxID=183260 RepID=A0ABR2P9J0_9ROSI
MQSILAFPYLISALYCRHGVSTYKNEKYTDFRTGWDRKHYLKKMDVADAIPIQVAIPTPAQSEHTEAPAAPADIAESSRARKRKTPAARIIREDDSPELTVDPPAAADPPAQLSPAKRRRCYHVIISDIDDDDENNDDGDDGSDDPASSKSLAF